MRSSRAQRHPVAAVRTPTTRTFTFALAIAIAGACTYANSLRGPFIWDDQTAILSNRTIAQLWPPTVPLNPPRETPVAGRPLVNLSFALNYAVGGLDETGYHVGNIAVHIVCALVLFGIVRRTLRGPKLRDGFARTADSVALVAAMFWMLHPLQSEPVDYITQRTESLMALCFLLTLYCGIRSRAGVQAEARLRPDMAETVPRGRRGRVSAGAAPHEPRKASPNQVSQAVRSEMAWSILAVVACAAGMVAKESMITAPLVVLLYDRVFVFSSWRDAIRTRKVLYAGLAATWIELGAIVAQQPRSTAGLSSAIDPLTYALNQLQMIVRYLSLVVWPGPLVLDYGLPRPLSFGDVVPHAVFLFVLIVAAAWASARRPAVGFLAATFFVTLAPTSSVIPIASEVGAERRMYLPCAALAVLAAVGLRWLLDRQRVDEVAGRRVRAAVVTVTAIAITACAVRTIFRNTEYATAVSLWRTVVERRPQGRARMALATELIGVGERDDAVAQLRTAVSDYPDARYGLGTELIADGKTDEGIAELRRFIDVDPLKPNRIPARTLVGQALASQGRLAESAAEFRAVLNMSPSNQAVRVNLADVLYSQQQYEPAAAEYRAALAAQPNSPALETKLATGLLAAGRVAEAIDHFRQALDLDPRSATVNRYLAEIYLRQQDVERGEAHARNAVRLDPRDGAAHNLLGVALASRGVFAEAVAEFREAVRIRPDDTQAQANLERALRVAR